MVSTILSAHNIGINGFKVSVEIDISDGLPCVNIVGLANTAVKESKDRVKSAIKNSGFKYPSNRITVNLSPGDIKKEGSFFDLPIATGILEASKQLKPLQPLKDFFILGELSLNGKIKPIRGALPVCLGLKKYKKNIILPKDNAAEVSIIDNMSIFGASSLQEICGFLEGKTVLDKIEDISAYSSLKTYDTENDFSQIKGHALAKRALEAAVCGNHNILMIGPPGSGKSMLAKRISGILPEMTLDEKLQTTKIHSICGLLKDNPLISQRPFRSPHHTISDVALVGGGTIAKPGEISIAHNGILFLDELPEFKRNALEALREPLEEGCVSISRVNYSIRYPASFMLIAAMNPCPCGYFTSEARECRCSPLQIERYRTKISGPLLDRIDIHIEVPQISYSQLTAHSEEEPSDKIKARVEKVRQTQLERFADKKINNNAEMGISDIKKFCKTDSRSDMLLKTAITELGISARGYHKILKVARTIADMEGKSNIEEQHIAEAIQYRSLDRKIW